MWGTDPGDRRLPEWIETSYETLEPHICNRDEGLSPEQVADLLLEEIGDDLALEPADAEYAIQRLLERGYLYKVEGVLFVTEPIEEA
jgi:hypothetical protein